MRVFCHQLIITYQTATCLENAAGDFGFSSGIIQEFIQIKSLGSVYPQLVAMNLSLGVFVR